MKRKYQLSIIIGFCIAPWFLFWIPLEKLNPRDPEADPQLLPGMGNDPSDDAYLAICVAVRDDAESIREWILYHNCIGVQKFYIYDDRSSKALLGTIKDFVASGLVEYR